MGAQRTSPGQGAYTIAHAVVFERPEALTLREIDLPPPAAGEVIVDVEWSGISTGTEKLLWRGEMPAFPGLGYPLVPGYETVGRVAACGAGSRSSVGDRVFVPGARCFGEIRGLFGGAASRLVVDESKIIPVRESLAEAAVLLALGATAHHALRAGPAAPLPELIVGHGVLGRLLARLTLALGGPPPTVWETDAARAEGALGYPVLRADEDPRRDYGHVVDVSGDPDILDHLVARLGRQGEIVLAGFYARPLAFTFPPAFMKEASIRVAAEWTPDDLAAVETLTRSGALALDDLITHRAPATEAASAYPTAFSDPDCLKMVLDWRHP
jgi:3-hydroxyethyl bacteriochlorophyllide a dehydrogenase